MKSLTVLLSLAFLVLLPFIVWATERPDWDYEGHFGPEHWSNANVNYGMCSEGRQQSPIDLDIYYETKLRPIELAWNETAWTVLHSGYTIQYFSENAGYAIIDDRRYELVRFQFHNPSEHRIKGNAFPMEAHFVHQAENGDIAIIAVMIEGGGVNQEFDHVIGHSPVRMHDRNELAKFDPSVLVTDLGDIYRYRGSLTAPPCSEGVMWTVLTDPLIVSNAAVLAFNSLFPLNARPLQEPHGRYVLRD